MANEPRELHSAEYFGEDRDHWWDHDSVAFLLHRWGLNRAKRILDVGCGVGHWGRVLLPHMPADAVLTGVDREPEWVTQATANARKRGLGDRTRYIRGLAEKVPFPDGSFDLVTCQTVLIHVPDCRAVILEMLRVLEPGGAILLAEPNNMAQSQAVGSHRFHESIEQRLALTRFQLTCERGKEALGEGNNSIGELIPKLLSEAGLRDIRISQSGHASPLIPPYESAAQRALRDQILDWAARDFWIWSKADSQRYFLAGGGSLPEFEQLWALAKDLARAEADGLKQENLYSAGGSVCYLFAATKAASQRDHAP